MYININKTDVSELSSQETNTGKNKVQKDNNKIISPFPKACKNPKPPYKPSKRKENQILLIKSIIVLGITIVAILLVFLFAKDYIEKIADWFSQSFGLSGVSIFVLVLDFIPIPIFPVDSIFTITIDWNPIWLLSVICLSSIIAGFLGYLMGKNLKRVRTMRRLVPLLLNKGRILIRKNALIAIIIAGLSPIPFATISWLAGYLNVRPHIYLIGALSRIPRYVIYFWLIRGSMELFL